MLEWTFSVANTFVRLKLALSGSSLTLIEASPESPRVIGRAFRGRVTASSIKTNATITFFSVNRIDTATYVCAVIDSDSESAIPPMQLIVLCKYKP